METVDLLRLCGLDRCTFASDGSGSGSSSWHVVDGILKEEERRAEEVPAR